MLVRYRFVRLQSFVTRPQTVSQRAAHTRHTLLNPACDLRLSADQERAGAKALRVAALQFRLQPDRGAVVEVQGPASLDRGGDEGDRVKHRG